MTRSRAPAILMVVLIAAALAFGVWHLLVLRFETGDVYPAYSTLRTDPLGTKVLYDALGEVGVAARERIDRLGDLLLGQASHLGHHAGEILQVVVERLDGVLGHIAVLLREPDRFSRSGP